MSARSWTSSPLISYLSAFALAASVVGPASAQSEATSPIWSIGTADARDELVFGFIADAAVDGDGNVFVLDAFAYELRWFDSAGTFRHRIGREGRGPGEWREPVAVATGLKGLIYVLDSGNRRLSLIRRRGNALEHERDISLPITASGVCVADSRMFLAAVDQSHVVHEIDSTGRVIHSFGSIDSLSVRERRELAGHGPIEQERRNAGRIVCDHTTGHIYLVQHAAHLVRAFALDGRELWRHRLADAHPAEVRVAAASEGRGIEIRPNAKSGLRSSAERIALGGNGTILIAIVVSDPARRDLRIRLDERILLRENGREIGRKAPGDAALVAVGGARYGLIQFPFARIIISK